MGNVNCVSHPEISHLKTFRKTLVGVSEIKNKSSSSTPKGCLMGRVS